MVRRRAEETPGSYSVSQERIFVASSTKAKRYAQTLCDRIGDRAEDSLDLSFDFWWNSFPAGETILGGLLSECDRCTFAIVLLTRDDLTIKSVETPRTNCWFEAGLFTGAFGQPRRVFLVSSVEEVAIASDIGGVVRVVFNEADAEKTLDTAARMIVDALRREDMPSRRGSEFQVHTVAELRALERRRPEGKLVETGCIVISATQPVEAHDPTFAARVWDNIQKVGIEYLYFFYADENSPSMIALLVWRLGTVGIEAQSMSEVLDHVKQNPDVVVQNLRRIRANLNVYLTPSEPLFQVCIHNSQSVGEAACYLQLPDRQRFLGWCYRAEAKRIADQLLKSRDEPAEQSIFGSTKGFDLSKEIDYRKKLVTAIERRFPEEVQAAVTEICFGR